MNTQVFKKLPLDEKGSLIKNEFHIQSPEDLVIVSFPKSGKTLQMVNQKNFLIGDPEGGTKYFKANNVVNLSTFEGDKEFVELKNGTFIPAGIFQTIDELRTANRMKEYWATRQALEDARPADKQKIYDDLIAHLRAMPFPVFAIDTITFLQELNLQAALAEYNKRFPTKQKQDIKKADDYGGVQYIRANFAGLKRFIENNSAPFKIWSGHIKEKKKILKKGVEEISAVDMALDGLLPTIFTARASAVCVFYRNDEGCFLDFTKKDESDLGSRPMHLSNKTIKIAEIMKEDEIYPTTYWDKVYPELTF